MENRFLHQFLSTAVQQRIMGLGTFFQLVLLIAQVLAEDKCNPIDTCSCKFDDGGKISLWPIEKNQNSPRFKYTTAGGNTYEYNPCTPFTDSQGGQCRGVLACQGGLIGAGPFAIAYNNKTMVNYDSNLKMYFFTYHGSPVVGTSFVRKTIIYLDCNTNAENPTLANFKESPSYTYTTTLTSTYACSKKGLSTGSILCIVFFSLVLVYIVAGVLLNKFFMHKEGSDVVPQKTFWVKFPSLVKDGAIFTYRRVRGKGGQYEQL
eukprot:Seg2051.4 transcript_id=Seg2051.4/GoldUCD/mRNA.D3Y31 product="Cation-dependent mannose-6-phosphate receptor" protein_id=Seg2051.4/GoldUCD/D3Y31